jgi:putative ABC transport system permease protein
MDWWRRFAHFFGREQVDGDISAEAQSVEVSRPAWEFGRTEEVLTDIRQALRAFRRCPGFVATATACLALGIGACVLIFSVVDAVLLRPLPFPESDRLVAIWFTPPGQPTQRAGTNALGYLTIRENSRSFETVGAARLTASYSVGYETNGGAPERVAAQLFTPELPRLLKAKTMLGRWPDERDLENAVGVVSYGLWQRVLGGRRDIIGKTLTADLIPFTVIGVTPPEFEFLNPDVRFWAFQGDANLKGGALRSRNRIFSVFARLKPGVTVEQAQAELDTLAPMLGKEMPESHEGWGLRVESLKDTYVGRVKRPLILFQGAVLFVLLIACANVAGLILARAASRRQELSVRTALGSGRWRIARQLLAESALLSAAGTALGVSLAWAGLRAFTALSPAGFPRISSIALSSNALAFAAVLAAATTLLCGIVPAAHISRGNLAMALRDSARGNTSGQSRLRAAFVVAQVALSAVLLTGSGLLLSTFSKLSSVQAGFDEHNLMTLQVTYPRTLYKASGTTPEGGLQVEVSPRLHRLTEEIQRKLASIPGVVSATSTVGPPLGSDVRTITFRGEGQLLSGAQQDAWTAEWFPAGPDYFGTMKVPLIRGRILSAQDDESGAPVAVVNETLARRLWPGQDPLGRRIQLGVVYDQPRLVVGVVGDTIQNRYQLDRQPQIYVPRVQLPAKMDMALSQQIMLPNTFLVRTQGSPGNYTSAIRAAVAEVDPTQAVSNIRTVEEYGSRQLDDLRQYLRLFSLFGVLALALASVGIFGVIANAVTERSNEIGIRRALGAGVRHIAETVLRSGMVGVGAGVVIGLAASLIFSRLMAGILWKTSAADPVTLAAVATVLVAVASLASFFPLRRALKIDPMRALRDQ